MAFFLPQKPVVDLPRIPGQDLFDVALAKKTTAGGLDGWAGNEFTALPPTWVFGTCPVCASSGCKGWVVGLSQGWPFEGLGQGVGFLSLCSAEVLLRRPGFLLRWVLGGLGWCLR